MFRDLQKGYTVSILDKTGGHLRYCAGVVVSRGEPRFEGRNFSQPGIPQMTAERVIDLTVETEGKTQTYVVPESGNVASTAGITLACETSYISNEVKSILKKSEDIISSVDTHRANIEECNRILGELNPALGESQEQSRRLDAIEGAMGDLRTDMNKILQQLSASLSQTKNKKEYVG